LTQIGKSVGLVDEKRWERFQNKLKGISKLKSYLRDTRSQGRSLWQQLRSQGNTAASQIRQRAAGIALDWQDKFLVSQIWQAVCIDAKYEGYLAKQQRLVAGLQSLESKKIPDRLDYNSITHLRAEAKEKLSAFAPGTLAQAGRISGITPADITVIQIHLKKYY
jgi:tRNA uridine 5-carboxymethylaminomethyl modification enzyme